MLPAVYLQAGPHTMEQRDRDATWQVGPWDVKAYLAVCFYGSPFASVAL